MSLRDLIVSRPTLGLVGLPLSAKGIYLHNNDLEIKPTKLIKGQGLEKLMEDSNIHALDINFIARLFDEKTAETLPKIAEIFPLSTWYADIVYILQHLNPPPIILSSKARSLNFKALKYCILNGVLYWKDPGGILLNCLIEGEVEKVITNFHKGDYEGHIYWKTMTNKILKAGFYCPTLFSNVYKTINSCH